MQQCHNEGAIGGAVRDEVAERMAMPNGSAQLRTIPWPNASAMNDDLIVLLRAHRTMPYSSQQTLLIYSACVAFSDELHFFRRYLICQLFLMNRRYG